MQRQFKIEPKTRWPTLRWVRRRHRRNNQSLFKLILFHVKLGNRGKRTVEIIKMRIQRHAARIKKNKAEIATLRSRGA